MSRRSSLAVRPIGGVTIRRLSPAESYGVRPWAVSDRSQVHDPDGEWVLFGAICSTGPSSFRHAVEQFQALHPGVSLCRVFQVSQEVAETEGVQVDLWALDWKPFNCVVVDIVSFPNGRPCTGSALYEVTFYGPFVEPRVLWNLYGAWMESPADVLRLVESLEYNEPGYDLPGQWVMWKRVQEAGGMMVENRFRPPLDVQLPHPVTFQLRESDDDDHVQYRRLPEPRRPWCQRLWEGLKAWAFRGPV